MGKKLNINQQSAHVAMKVNTLCVRKSSASRLREMILPLSTCEVTSGILPPVPAQKGPVQKGHGHTGVPPGHREDTGLGAFVI